VSRTKSGRAIRRARRRPAQLEPLDAFIVEAKLKNEADAHRAIPESGIAAWSVYLDSVSGTNMAVAMTCSRSSLCSRSSGGKG